jgi:hypothetical protein
MHPPTPAVRRTDRVAVVVSTHARRGALALPLVHRPLQGVADKVTVLAVDGGAGLVRAVDEAMADDTSTSASTTSPPVGCGW